VARGLSAPTPAGAASRRWIDDAVVYEVYPRSFQDSDDDGIGDLEGVRRRLPHLEWLGVDALWLAPIYASPLADFGYDVSDHKAIAPEFGTDRDFDRLVGSAHARGIRVVLDLVASHTSIEHPWFRQRPDFYVWSEGEEPPNNWLASFGGPAWSRDAASGRFYLHSFYPEQPDLNWRNPEVREAMKDVVRHWIGRGVDGFRVDAADRLLKDPDLRDDPPTGTPFPLPLPAEQQHRDLIHSRDAPDIGIALGALREAAGEAPLVGEVYLPADRLPPYLEHFDAVFAFDFLHARWDASEMAGAVARAAAVDGIAWVASNHDFPRVATRWGAVNVRAAAVLLLMLGGPTFIYQGEELGMIDGPDTGAGGDRYGRDGCRRPMQWDGTPNGGFTGGHPWLDLVDPAVRNVAAQVQEPGSTLELFRRLIELRSAISGRARLAESPEGTVVFDRGDHRVAINVGDRPVALPEAEAHAVVLDSSAPAAAAIPDGSVIAPHGGLVLRRDGSS
jgi:alpha-glucosidase